MSSAAPTLDERGLPRDYPFRPDWEITPRELSTLQEKVAVLIVDCRTEQERAICRIADSLHAPLHELERRFDDLRESLEDDGFATIVVHCHHGMRSLKATAILRAAGFADVRSLAGGINLWALDIQPGMPTY